MFKEKLFFLYFLILLIYFIHIDDKYINIRDR
jgi:hypothetical protein